MDRSQDATTQIAGNDRLDLVGGLARRDGALVSGVRKGVADGGSSTRFPERILVENATSATIVLTAATSYRGGDPKATRRRGSSRPSQTKGYERVRADHIADHQRLFRRVTLRLGPPKRSRRYRPTNVSNA